MNIETSIRILRPIDQVWAVLAEDFTSIQTWSASVITSTPLEHEPIEGAPMGGRYCTFTSDPDGFAAREAITRFDAEHHTLEFDVEPVNAPAALPMRHNHVRVTLRRISETETELVWLSTPQLKWHGYVVYPLLRAGLTKSFSTLLAEFKTFVESDAQARAA